MISQALLGVLLITAIAGVGGTGLGGVVSACFKRDSSKLVSLLLSFAGGVMLAIVCFDLLSSALAEESASSSVSIMHVLLGVISGYVIVAVLNALIDKSTNHEIPHIQEDDHPKTADDLDELIHSDHYREHERENSQLFVAGLVMAAAIALHNLPEGMVLGASYTGQSATSVWAGRGFLVAVVIGLHNIPEGMAVAVPLMAGGMNRGRAVLITALSGLPTVIGALLGYLLGSMGPVWHTLSLSFASGAMLYVVFGELLPESILMWRSKMPALGVFIGMLVGVAIIYI